MGKCVLPKPLLVTQLCWLRLAVDSIGALDDVAWLFRS